MRFTSPARVLGVAALAVTVGLAGLATAGLTAPLAAALHQQDRVAGANRFDTAAEISKVLTAGRNNGPYPGIVQTEVVLVNGLDFPDALAAAAMAGKKDARILLTERNTTPPDTQAELDALGSAINITIVGGSAAVSEAQATRLDAAFGTITRVKGENRFATAAAVANRLGAAPSINNGNGALPTVFLADGYGFADALSAGPGAHKRNIPILLHDRTGRVQANTGAAIRALGVKQVIILGGAAAVPASVETDLANYGVTAVARLAGANRYETAAKVAQFHLDILVMQRTWGFLASGDSFADALAGAPLSAAHNGPVVLARTCALPPETRAFFEANNFTNIELLGGTAALCEAVNTEAQTLKAKPVAGVTEVPELVSAVIVRTVTTTQATPTNPAGTTIRYTFDENLSGAPGGAARFSTFGTTAPSNAAAGVAGSVIVSLSSATVDVRFTGIDTDAKAASLATANVLVDAVNDVDGNGSEIGSAVLNASVGGQSLKAGTTTGPDVKAVSAPRAGSNASKTNPPAPATSFSGQNVIDITFDEVAYAENPTRFQVVATHGDVQTCSSQAQGTATGAVASGGSIPGGNGTTKLTIACPNFVDPANPGAGVALKKANLARVVVLDGAVDDTAAAGGGVQNPPTGFDVAGTSANPDLVSATFSKAANATDTDDVVFIFDEAVRGATGNGTAGPDAPSPETTLFAVYNTAGTVIAGGATTGYSVNASARKQVLIQFPRGTLANAVGVAVGAGAVTSQDGGAGVANAYDAVGVANNSPATTGGKITNRPRLVSASRTQPTDGFGNPQDWVADFVFDEEPDLTQAPGGTSPQTTAAFGLVTRTGRSIQCASAAATPGQTAGAVVSVRCSAFTAPTGFSAAQVQSALATTTLAAVGGDAVRDFGAAGTATAQNYPSSKPLT